MVNHFKHSFFKLHNKYSSVFFPFKVMQNEVGDLMVLCELVTHRRKGKRWIYDIKLKLYYPTVSTKSKTPAISQ